LGEGAWVAEHRRRNSVNKNFGEEKSGKGSTLSIRGNPCEGGKEGNRKKVDKTGKSFEILIAPRGSLSAARWEEKKKRADSQKKTKKGGKGEKKKKIVSARKGDQNCRHIKNTLWENMRGRCSFRPGARFRYDRNR